MFLRLYVHKLRLTPFILGRCQNLGLGSVYGKMTGEWWSVKSLEGSGRGLI